MELLYYIQELVWGPLLLVLVLGTGIYLTIRLRFIQILKLPLAMKYIVTQEKDAEGDISTFAALCTALAATIGTGNIVGVATALRIGGAGALFWMWVSAFLGMATKYAESCLSVKYRTADKNGQRIGGPMFYITHGMGEKWKWLAKTFAFFGVLAAYFGCGVFAQINAIAEASKIAFNASVPAVGLIVAFIVGIVILGGIESVAKVAQWCVPFMALTYVVGGIFCISANSHNLPWAIKTIFHSAFTSSAVIGGGAGAAVISVMTAMRIGIARGIFSNESGLGSASIVAAAAKTSSCVRQGLVSMTGTFFDTLCVCTITGLVILTSGAMENSSLQGVALTNAAFTTGIATEIGIFIVTVGLIFFAFTSIIGWNYYGERCLVFLTGGTKWLVPYRILYIILIALAPHLTLTVIWTVGDIANACMALPNLIALLVLSGIVCKETKAFFHKD
ncbi:MAG: sodium:alanine symporter family protein [Epulopiscium sp.]|jgi:AGCS family alanine or glycine:cation symporter|nr:sodium:alanine symporter family protein [Candidatus Epulonipiscium sp.]